MGCELSKQIPAKKKVSTKRVTRKVSKAAGVAINLPILPVDSVRGSTSGTTHSGDSPADLAEVRTFASTPEPGAEKVIPVLSSSYNECGFDEEVLDALAQVDEEHKRRKETEFRAILRGILKQK